MKNTLEGLNITLDDIKGWISEMKDRVVEITEDEQKKKKRIKRNKDSLRALWDNSCKINESQYEMIIW